MGQGPDAESGESRICCKQPDGLGERLGRAKDGDSLTVVSSERLKEGLDYAAQPSP